MSMQQMSRTGRVRTGGRMGGRGGRVGGMGKGINIGRK